MLFLLIKSLLNTTFLGLLNFLNDVSFNYDRSQGIGFLQFSLIPVNSCPMMAFLLTFSNGPFHFRQPIFVNLPHCIIGRAQAHLRLISLILFVLL